MEEGFDRLAALSFAFGSKKGGSDVSMHSTPLREGVWFRMRHFLPFCFLALLTVIPRRALCGGSPRCTRGEGVAQPRRATTHLSGPPSRGVPLVPAPPLRSATAKKRALPLALSLAARSCNSPFRALSSERRFCPKKEHLFLWRRGERACLAPALSLWGGSKPLHNARSPLDDAVRIAPNTMTRPRACRNHPKIKTTSILHSGGFFHFRKAAPHPSSPCKQSEKMWKQVAWK